MSQTVLVTGACVNTGAAIVKKFAAQGWNVAFTGRDAGRVRNAEKAYRDAFPSARVDGYVLSSLQPDGTVDNEGVARLFDTLEARGDFVSAAVLNAADLGLNMRIFENPLEDFSRVINANVVWNYCIAEHAARRMVSHGGGSIVFVNSNTAYRAIPDRIAYQTSKAAQLGMMRGLAIDLGRYNIRVNAVLAGLIKTDRWEKNPAFYADLPARFTPLGDVARGDDIADGVYYLCAHARNTTGAELVIDGGNSVQLYPIRRDI